MFAAPALSLRSSRSSLSLSSLRSSLSQRAQWNACFWHAYQCDYHKIMIWNIDNVCLVHPWHIVQRQWESLRLDELIHFAAWILDRMRWRIGCVCLIWLVVIEPGNSLWSVSICFGELNDLDEGTRSDRKRFHFRFRCDNVCPISIGHRIWLLVNER